MTGIQVERNRSQIIIDDILHVWIILFDVGNAFKQIPFYQTKDK